jgi:hypothetical protein
VPNASKTKEKMANQGQSRSIKRGGGAEKQNRNFLPPSICANPRNLRTPQFRASRFMPLFHLIPDFRGLSFTSPELRVCGRSLRLRKEVNE